LSNPHKGELSFEADGKFYTLRFSTNAICELEDELDRGIVDIAAEMSSWANDSKRIRLGFLRAVFWAGLRDAQPDIDIKAAGELILSAGGIATVSGLIGTAFERAFPGPETKGSRPTRKVPTVAQHGTG
jgi:hypothetical protein